MASPVEERERLTITITGTNLTGTAEISLSTPARCIPYWTTVKVSNASSEADQTMVSISIADATVTATRDEGADLGTITAEVEILQLVDGTVIQSGSINLTGTQQVVSLGTGINELADAFLVFTYYHTGSVFDGRRWTCAGYISSLSDVTFDINVSSLGDIIGTFFVVENTDLNCESLTISITGTGTSGTTAIGDTLTLSSATLLASQTNAYPYGDLDTNGVRVWLSDIDEASASRANGGASESANTTIRLQAIQWPADVEVQRGTLTIASSATSGTATLGSAVDAANSGVGTPMIHGMGESQGTNADSDMARSWAAFVLTDEDTVTASVVSTISADHVFSYEAVQWIPSAGGTPVSQSFGVQAETLQGLGPSFATQLEGTQGLSQGFATAHEALGGLAVSFATETESLQGLSASYTTAAEVLEGLSAAIVSAVEVLGTLQVSFAAQVEVLSALEQSYATAVEVLASLAQTHALHAEVLQGLSADRILQFEALGEVVSPVSQSFVIQLETLQGVVAERILQDESSQELVASLGLEVESVRELAASFASAVEVLQRVEQTYQANFETLLGLAVSQSFVLRFEALGSELEISDITSGALDAFTIELLTDPIIYFPLGTGAGLARRAVVERGVVRPLDFVAGRASGHEVEFWIANNEAIGVADVRPGRDTVELVLVEGEAPVRCLVTEIVSSDEGAWHLIAHR